MDIWSGRKHERDTLGAGACNEAEVGVRLRIWSEKERVEGPRIPEGVDRPRIARRFRILKEDVERYSPTPGCQ